VFGGQEDGMSSIGVSKMINDQVKYAGRDWWYDFRELPMAFDEEDVKGFWKGVAAKHGRAAAGWTSEQTSIWIVRNYFSMRLMLWASVLAQSHEFADQVNLGPLLPYCRYYAVLSCMRAMVISSPDQPWHIDNLFGMTHSKTLNIAIDILGRIDQGFAIKVLGNVKAWRDSRELFSYRGPSAGNVVPTMAEPDWLEVCRVCGEVAQMQSELLERALEKRSTPPSMILAEHQEIAVAFQIGDQKYRDAEDRYRIGYLNRKWRFPVNIIQMATEGHVEDYFGAWYREDSEDEGVFNPDDDWSVLFSWL
jgi:hypothetical protein